MRIKLGKNGKFYRGPAGATAGTEIKNVMDVTVNLEWSEEDATTRASGDFEISDDVLISHSIEFEMPVKDGDPDIAAVQAAFKTRAAIALLALDKASGFGVDADYRIRKFARSEPVKGKMVYSVTAKPTDETRAPVLTG